MNFVTLFELITRFFFSIAEVVSTAYSHDMLIIMILCSWRIDTYGKENVS